MEDDQEGFKIIIDENTILPDGITQEELDTLVEELKELADSGELFENSVFVDMEVLEMEDPELYAILSSEFKDTTYN
jgi:hypothetical protein